MGGHSLFPVDALILPFLKICIKSSYKMRNSKVTAAEVSILKGCKTLVTKSVTNVPKGCILFITGKRVSVLKKLTLLALCWSAQDGLHQCAAATAGQFLNCGCGSGE
ncbi:hypothetical protein PoB_005491500 [Plakobranchus ocellatus]|uniref:Uncharacterized protein n=1 Tax=Plakobranchus ocellatus TaxID=259542 RepID=A0AAV4CAG8_9GAST|nr:hypothetical protein PoB_005491500 [Plakobranchus ocellatus]